MDYYLDKNYYFITCRTILQEKYFIEDCQKQLILEQLFRVKKMFNLEFDAYSILSNHYHLLFYLVQGLNLKKVMQIINGGSSHELNKVTAINRSIWDKYHNNNVLSKEIYFKVLGYIIGNPFKHGLVKSISQLKDYKFCNYNEVTEKYGQEGADEIISRVNNLNWDLNIGKAH